MRSDDTREGRNMKYAKWRQRLRGMCKWSGVLCCALIVGLWVLSAFRAILWDRSSTARIRQLSVAAGYVQYLDVYLPQPVTRMKGNGHAPDVPTAHLTWTIIPLNPPIWNSFLSPSLGQSGPGFVCPLWIPLVLIALPTGSLFWSDRHKRTRVGRCAMCGYDLTGNTSGTCPECGATTPARAAI